MLIQCTRCKEFKDDAQFYNSKKSKNGKSCWCKECHQQKDKERYIKKYNEIRQKQKKYREKNKNKLNKTNSIYQKEHYDTLKIYRQQRYQKIKEKELSTLSLYSVFNFRISNYEETRRDPRDLNLLQVRCKYCGKWFTPTRSSLIGRLQSIECDYRKGESLLYCSDSCKHACPVYNQKKYPKGFAPATSREVQPELRKMVLERDNWTCQKCGKTKEENPELELHCHHIDPVVNNPIESADVDNCMTLCKICHTGVHILPGCSDGDLVKCANNRKY